jgi:hypothetical protein
VGFAAEAVDFGVGGAQGLGVSEARREVEHDAARGREAQAVTNGDVERFHTDARTQHAADELALVPE